MSQEIKNIAQKFDGGGGLKEETHFKWVDRRNNLKGQMEKWKRPPTAQLDC